MRLDSFLPSPNPHHTAPSKTKGRNMVYHIPILPSQISKIEVLTPGFPGEEIIVVVVVDSHIQRIVLATVRNYGDTTSQP